MGTCYSSHSHTGKRTYPSDMSINSDRSSRVPLPRPAYTDHSNKMPEKPGDRAALTPRSQSATRLPLPRSEASPSSRFGFKKSGLPTAKSGVMRSTDSIDSAASDISRSSTGSQRRSLGASYAPRDSKGWKMIDDSSTTMDSRSQSVKSKSTRSGDSKNTTPVRSASHTGARSAGNKQGSSRLSAGTSVTNNRPPASPGSDRWVKAAPIDSAESLKENRNQINTKKKFGFFGRSKSATSQGLQKNLQIGQKGESSNTKKKLDKEQSVDEDDASTTQGSVDNLNQTFVVDDQSNKSDQNPVNETFVVAEKEETVQTSVILIETGVSSLPKVSTKPGRGLSFEMEKSVETVKEVQGHGDAFKTEPLRRESSGERPKGSQKIPLARMDSVDSTSISSLNSDDLMLDLDLGFEDEMTQSMSSSMEKSMTRPRAMSDLSESGSFSRQERRPNPTRPRLSESHGLPRRNLLERQASDRQLRARGHSIATGEAVQELGSLITDAGVQRRNPRIESSTRPASFPGPLGSGGEELATVSMMMPRPFNMRPPRQPSLIEDEDQVAVDGYTYRHMQQDITTFKTMLLKLKRVIQEDELGSPMDPGYKNGIKYSFGSSAGTPDSPLVKTEESWKAALQASIEPAGGPALTEVVQENSELRQQLQVMEKKLEDQQKTIKLLQQQMDTVMKLQRGYSSHNNYVNRNRTRIIKTKYECGHMGPGGCVYSNAATQTDKPRLGATARGGARGSSRASGGAAENVISSSMNKDLRNSTEKLAKVQGSLEKGRSLLQPPTNVKDRDARCGSPRQNFARTKEGKTSVGKPNSVHLRPKSSTQLPSHSSTVPLIRRSAGNPVSASRTSLDSQRSSSDSRISTDSGRRSLNNSNKKRLSERRSSVETKSSSDTGIAELSPAETPENVTEEVTRENSGGNCTPRTPGGRGGPQVPGGRDVHPITNSRPPSSRLPGSRLARPYGATRGSRLASLLNRNTSGIPAKASQQ